MENASADPLIGSQVGPCRVEALLGRGGMGVVYKARHLSLDRPMALKVLAPSLHRGAQAEAALLREAGAAARLDDPRIVRVYDAGRQGELTWVAMELVEGQTLDALVRWKGPLQQADALHIVKETARALAVAHKAGLVHRDVKPANILRTSAGAVKLTDFGLAAPAGAGQPEGDGLIGSFDYMAPEQPFSASPDPRLDLYSLGCTWFFLLAGRAPYKGETPGDMLIQHRESPVPDVREFRRDALPAAAELIARLMRKLPEQRPASAGELLALLESPSLQPPETLGRSPFQVLPPPVAAKEGLRAELAAQGIGMPPTPPGDPLPPPPPPVYHGESSPWPGRLIVFGLWAALTGRAWLSVVAADRAAAGVFAGLAAALLCLWGAQGRSRALLSLLWLAMAGAFAWMAGGRLAGFEALVAGGLGLAAGLGGLYLGLFGDWENRMTAAALIAAGCAGLFAAAVPAETGFAGLPAEAGRLAREVASSGGLWRWGGLGGLSLAYAIGRYTRLDPSEWARKRSRSGRIINWNK